MKNKILKDWFDGFNNRDWTTLEGLYSNDATIHGRDRILKGGKEVVEISKRWIASIPDAHLIPISIEEDNNVITAHWRFEGVMEGPIRDIPASGENVNCHGLTCFRFSQDKIVEHWATIDYRALRSQSGTTTPKEDMAHTVMVILESVEGKEDLLKSSLAKIAELSRLEDSCIEYRFYQDKENPCRFGLYEKWKSKELHLEQFTKPYILDFMKESETWLEKPYEAIFAKEV